MLANLGGLLWGEWGGGEEGDREEEEGAAGDAQQPENGGVTQEPPLRHAPARQRVPLHAAGESLAAARDAVQAQEVAAAVAEERQQLESDGEYWEPAMTKNAHWSHGALELAAGMLYQQGLDLVQRETPSVGVGCYFLTDCSFGSFLRGAAGFDSKSRKEAGAGAEAGHWR